jgi:uncharacterized protein DUF4440
VLVPALAFAQVDGATTRIPTVTRLVKQFYELETTLAAKLAARDVAALDGLLDANFEVRRDAMPGVPIPRDEWLRSAADVATPKLDQIAVHDFGAVAVVSFRQVDAKPSSKAAKQRMIVDCWTRSGERWLLTVRYEGAAMPATPASRGDKRPTGRQ